MYLRVQALRDQAGLPAILAHRLTERRDSSVEQQNNPVAAGLQDALTGLIEDRKDSAHRPSVAIIGPYCDIPAR